MNNENALTLTEDKDVKDIGLSINSMKQLVKQSMEENFDYGIIPGTKDKSLWDPGAEKLASFYGLVPDYVAVDKVENFENGFFYYTYKCVLTHFKSGKVAGASERSCNSYEPKFLFKTEWVNGTKSKKRKTPEDLAADINVYKARAQKRAFVEAVKTATNASSIFRGDAAKETVAPMKKVTKEEDPERVRLLSKFYAVATERGFDQEKAKNIVKKKYKVESVTEISNADLTQTIENLTKNWQVVGKGNEPVLMSAVDDAEIVQTNENTVTANDLDSSQAEDIDEPGLCKNCNSKPAVFNQYYCSQECQDEYYYTLNPKARAAKKFDEFLTKKNK